MDYPELTNYQYASDEPIANVDMDGLEKVGVCGVADWFHEGENVVSSSATKALASAGSKNIASAASKGFSLTQLGLNAIKIAAGVVRGQMAAQTINQRLSNPIVQQQVTDAVFDFYKANQNNMSFLEYMKLGILTNNYFNGLNLMAWWSGTDFLKLDRNVISGSEGHISDIKRIAITEAGIEDEQIGMYGIIGEGASTSLFISAMGLFPEVGAGPRVPFSSNTQQQILDAAKLKVQPNVNASMGSTYKAIGEVTSPIKNTGLLHSLNNTSKGNWVKVYEAGLNNGKKIEVHYFRNNTTKEVFDVKVKYNNWHQKAFKTIKP